MEAYCLREVSTLPRLSAETRLGATGVRLIMATQSPLSLPRSLSLSSVSSSSG